MLQHHVHTLNRIKCIFKNKKDQNYLVGHDYKLYAFHGFYIIFNSEYFRNSMGAEEKVAHERDVGKADRFN